MPDEISFGGWLRQRRRSLDLTQQQLADQAGCARITLRRIEANTLKPSKELAQILLEKVGIPEAERAEWGRFARGLSNFPQNSLQESVPRPPPTNLPVALTTFIGREKEQEEIVNLLEKNRLVTLAGVGGIGKTRLAWQVGQELLNDYPNGIWFVTLDSLSDSALVPQTVASVFDLRESRDRPIIEILTNVLREKTTLLILDNCEHLLEACTQLITILLQNCLNLKVLATSREILNVQGQAVYHLPSLSIPEDQVSMEKLTQYESIQLFAHRAALALSSFQFTKENAQAVIDICRKVDGIPLAIELAAAYINILQPKEILKQLNESISLLSTDSRSILPRHQTMRASMDWSWSLLSESEQVFLQQLSVFAGGWALESAEAVCEGDALNLTSALVKKSMIIVTQKSEGETRYGFHETVRQYAREKLVQAGEEAHICTGHLQYFLQLSEEAETGLKGPTQIKWMSRLNDERDNIRAALEWADKTDVEAGLYVSGRLIIFWEIFDIREGAHWLEEFIQKTESRAYSHARAKALCALGWSKNSLDRLAEAHSAAQESLDLCRTCGDKYGEIDALLLLTAIVSPSEAEELSRQALTLAESINDKWRTAQALFESSWGRYERYSYIEKALTLFQAVGDLRNMGHCMAELGRLRMLNNDIESAENLLSKAIVLFRELDIKSGISGLLQGYGRIAAIKGDYELAYAYFKEDAAIDEEYGYRVNYLFARSHLGYLALNQGNITEAHEIFTETLQSFFKDKTEIGVAFTLEGMAGLFVTVGKPEIAVQLIGWADALRERVGDPRPPLEQADVDKIIAACVAKMGKAAFTEAYEQGKKMTLDEAVAYALKED